MGNDSSTYNGILVVIIVDLHSNDYLLISLDLVECVRMHETKNVCYVGSCDFSILL